MPRAELLELALAHSMSPPTENENSSSSSSFPEGTELPDSLKTLAMDPVYLIKLDSLCFGLDEDHMWTAWLGVSASAKVFGIVALRHGVFWVVHGKISSVKRSSQVLESSSLTDRPRSFSAASHTQYKIVSTSDFTVLREKDPLDDSKRLIESSLLAFGLPKNNLREFVVAFENAQNSANAVTELEHLL